MKKAPQSHESHEPSVSILCCHRSLSAKEQPKGNPVTNWKDTGNHFPTPNSMVGFLGPFLLRTRFPISSEETKPQSWNYPNTPERRHVVKLLFSALVLVGSRAQGSVTTWGTNVKDSVQQKLFCQTPKQVLESSILGDAHYSIGHGHELPALPARILSGEFR